jgi:hypothetical protein
MFNILGHKTNANQNNIEILSQSSQKYLSSKHQQQQMLARMWGENSPYILCKSI